MPGTRLRITTGHYYPELLKLEEKMNARLLILAAQNQRSPAQQIAFLVEVAQNAPTDAELRLTYGESLRA